MRIRTALSCIIASLLAVTKAQAASPQLIDVVRPKALLQLDGMEQAVSFLYTYTGVHTPSSSSSSQQLQERYHLGTAFTVIDPELLQFTLGGDVGFSQTFASNGGSTKGATYQYMFSANALQFDPYPVSVVSSRTVSDISTAYLPTYTATTNSNQVWLRLLNNKVPISLHYTRTSLDTEGLGRDSSTTTNNVSLSSSYKFRERSTSELSLNYNGTDTEVEGHTPESSRTYSLVGTNTTLLDKESKYSLSSSVSFAESKQGSVPQRTANLTETFSGIFGKTLQGHASYQHDYNKTVGFDTAKEQLQESDVLTASLSHQLFQSLATGVNGMWQSRRLSGGDETDYGGGVGINYQKRLPKKSLLRVGVSGNRTYVDREGTTSELIVRDEVHRAPDQGQWITLTSPGNLGSVLNVESRNPQISYSEGRDYTVNLALSRIEIVSGGNIVPGTDLYISYTVMQNSAIQYYTDNGIISASLSLFENRYLLSAEYSKQSQTLISGDTDRVGLFDSSTARLRIDANYIENFLTAEYANVDSGQTKYSYLNSSWRYVKKFAYSDVSTNVQNRLTMFDATDTSSSSTENQFSMGGSYSRGVFTWGRLTLSGNYSNTSGGASRGGSSNFLYLRGNLLGRINRLQFSLTGQSSLRFKQGETTRNDSLLFAITRSF